MPAGLYKFANLADNSSMKMKLKELMHERRLRFRQVEIITGIKRATISDIANGKTRPRFDDLEQLAEGLGVMIRDFVESKYL